MTQLSFLPEPPYNPKYPKDHTLALRALTLLLTGRKISHPQFEAQTGSWRLAAHVHILKKLGWPVRKYDREMDGHDAEARERHYGVYYLPDGLLEFMRGV